MTAILLALLASFAWGFSDYAGGVASRSVRVPVVLSLAMAAGLVIVAPAALSGGAPALQDGEGVWAACSGAIAVGSLGLMFAAMAIGPVSIVGPVSACGVALPVIVGLAQGDRPAAVQLAGMALGIAGVVLASIEQRQDDHGKRVVAGLGLALCSAVFVGLWFVTFDRAATHDPYWATLISRSTTVVLATAVALLWRPRAEAGTPAPAGLARVGDDGHWVVLAGAGRRVVLLIVASGLADAVAETAFAVSTTHGLVSIVSVIASLYPAFMVGFAALWLRERPARHQLAGVVAVLAGIALISAG